jgi:hypothetical protein
MVTFRDLPEHIYEKSFLLAGKGWRLQEPSCRASLKKNFGGCRKYRSSHSRSVLKGNEIQFIKGDTERILVIVSCSGLWYRVTINYFILQI